MAKWISTVLFVLAGVFWVRSYFVCDSSPSYRKSRVGVVVHSWQGHFVLVLFRNANPHPKFVVHCPCPSIGGRRVPERWPSEQEVEENTYLYEYTSGLHGPRLDNAFGFQTRLLDANRVAFRIVMVPYWFLLLLLGLLPTARLLGQIRRHARHRRGLCPNCGYDLRATPDRCPECGRLTGNG